MNREELKEQAKSLKLIRLSKLKKAEIQALIEARFAKSEIPLRHLDPSLVFKSMMNMAAWDWSDEQLNVLTIKYLQSLCLLMGCPRSGTKAKVIERLKLVANARKVLKDFKSVDDVQVLADSMKGKELKHLCKQVKAYAGSTKYAMAASLINWKINCMRTGQQNYKDAIADIKAKAA